MHKVRTALKWTVPFVLTLFSLEITAQIETTTLLQKLAAVKTYDARQELIGTMSQTDSMVTLKSIKANFLNYLHLNAQAGQSSKALTAYNVLAQHKEDRALQDSLNFYEPQLNEHVSTLKNNDVDKAIFLMLSDDNSVFKKQEEAIPQRLLESKAIFERVRDSAYSDYAALYYSLGSYNAQQNSWIAALENYQKSIKLYEYQKNDNEKYEILGEIASLYAKHSIHSEARRIRKKIINFYKGSDNYTILTLEHLNNSSGYFEQNKFKKAHASLDSAIFNASKSNATYLGFYCYYNASTFAFKEKDDTAFYTYRDSLEVYYNNYKGLAFFDGLKAQIDSYNALFKKDISLAKSNAQNFLSLTKDLNNTELELDAYELLSDIEEQLENYKSSYTYLNAYNKLNDSIKTDALSNQALYYQTVFETERNEEEISKQRYDIELLNNENKLKTQYLIFGGLGLVLVFGIIMALRAAQNQKRKQKILEKHSQDLVATQEQEKVQLARELHDSVGQKLMLLSKNLTTSSNPDAVLSAECLTEIREISRGLYPAILSNYGLTAAIEQLVNKLDDSTDTFFLLEQDNIDSYVGKSTALHMYRIIQESLTNIIKHAQASEVLIEIKRQSQYIIIDIKDNGVGFEHKNFKSSLGLETLKDRANIIGGSLKFKTASRQGTHILLKVPIKNV